MSLRTQLLPWIFGCILLAIIIFVGGKVGALGFVRDGVTVLFQPLQKIAYHGSIVASSNESDLEKENTALRTALSKTQTITNDNKALRDQFATSTPASHQLLPATVIGSPGLLPGVTKPELLIIDKGSKDNVHIGSTVVYKDNLIGSVSKISAHESEVTLVSSSTMSFPAKTQTTGALGILRGEGNGEMVLDNVILSDTLQKGDTVVTKGNSDGKGNGFLPNLVIGKIIAVNKKASDIFQSGEVASLVDVSRLDMVFIEMNE